MPSPKTFSFTLRVDVPFRGSKKTQPLEAEDGDDFRFLLDLNPDSFIFEGDSDMQIDRVRPILDKITNYLNYIQDLSNKRGYTPRRIAKIAYKRNSPALANVSFLTAVNGDMEPPVKRSGPGK